LKFHKGVPASLHARKYIIKKNEARNPTRKKADRCFILFVSLTLENFLFLKT
jgi:hypothetical protein